MALIVHKQLLPRYRGLILLLLPILVLSLVVIYLTFLKTEKATIPVMNNEEQAPYYILQNALAYMHGGHALLDVEIQERGEGYLLNFKGKKLGQKTLSGELVDYNLGIYKNRYGDLYVRDLISGMWTDAEDLQLDALKEFLVMPFELLANYSEHNGDAVFIRNDGYTGYKVIKLPLPPQYVIPSMASTTENISVDCFLFIAEDKPFINRITYLIYDQGLERELIYRTFIFNEASNLYKWNRQESETRHLQVSGSRVFC